jgi:hypothetical protein
MIISVIGYSHSGKTVFIKQYFHTDVLFDMKTFYSEHQIDPLKRRRSELAGMLYPAVLAKIAEAQKRKKFLIIEHSGIGQISDLIFKFDHLTIWISTPMEIINERIKKSTTPTPTFTRFDAIALNEKINSAILLGQIRYDVEYDTTRDLLYLTPSKKPLNLPQLRKLFL